jgi:hypothetical protein
MSEIVCVLPPEVALALLNALMASAYLPCRIKIFASASSAIQKFGSISSVLRRCP